LINFFKKIIKILFLKEPENNVNVKILIKNFKKSDKNFFLKMKKMEQK